MPKTADFKTVTIGDIRVSFLSDGGGISNPLAIYPASSEEGWQAYPDQLDNEGKSITSIGAFLVEIGSRKIAVDTAIGPNSFDFPGVGQFYGGKYLDSLKQTGVSPAEVTDVVFTHLHLDHCGWTTIESDGKRQLLYPNARYFVTATEWEFWYGGDNPAGPHPEHVQAPLEDRIETIEAGEIIAPGMTVIPTPGHTPGHISLRLDSGEQRLFLTADILNGPVQLVEPTWSVAFDTDPELARKSREGLYPELVKPNTVSGINHFPDAVFGRIREADSKLTWTPL
jgi:glyoxylase-like metal-dependent hydrolase (beta-lactamase superfamily II)